MCVFIPHMCVFILVFLETTGHSVDCVFVGHSFESRLLYGYLKLFHEVDSPRLYCYLKLFYEVDSSRLIPALIHLAFH